MKLPLKTIIRTTTKSNLFSTKFCASFSKAILYSEENEAKPSMEDKGNGEKDIFLLKFKMKLNHINEVRKS